LDRNLGILPPRWLNGACASWAGGREFEFQRPAKSYTALQTVRHRFNIYAGSFVALTLWRRDGHRKFVKRLGLGRNTTSIMKDCFFD